MDRLSADTCPHCQAELTADEHGQLCPPNEQHAFVYRPANYPLRWVPWGRYRGTRGGGSQSGGPTDLKQKQEAAVRRMMPGIHARRIAVEPMKST